MSLQDEHLKKALRNAPDNDAAPNDATRKRVLDYALKSNAKSNVEQEKVVKPSWLVSKLNSVWVAIQRWPIAGVSGAMTAVLVIVMVSDYQPDQPVFTEDDFTSMKQAQLESKAVESVELDKSILSESPAPAVEEESVMADAAPKKRNKTKVDVQDTDMQDELGVARKSPALTEVPPKESVPKMAVQKKSTSKKAIPKNAAIVEVEQEREVTVAATPDAMVAEGKTEVLNKPKAAAEDVATENDADVAGYEFENRGVLAGRSDKTDSVKEKGLDQIELAKKEVSETKAAAPAVSASRSRDIEVLDSAAIEARARGYEQAVNDIDAGILRILSLDTSLGANVIDEITGYRIDVVSDRPITKAFKVEIEAYNKAMRDLHADNLSKDKEKNN